MSVGTKQPAGGDDQEAVTTRAYEIYTKRAGNLETLNLHGSEAELEGRSRSNGKRPAPPRNSGRGRASSPQKTET